MPHPLDDHRPPPPPRRPVSTLPPAGADEPLIALTHAMVEVSADLAYARRRMDVSTVTSQFEQVDALWQAAWTDLRHGQQHAARRSAIAADFVLRAARDLMLNDLGDALPSAQSRRPRPPMPDSAEALAHAERRIGEARRPDRADARTYMLLAISRDLYRRALKLEMTRRSASAAQAVLAINPLLDAVEVLCEA